MSRLDSMIRRLIAQRDGLLWAKDKIAGIQGDILELGLGNGRTYDHLREHFTDRDIWVIDRVCQPHPDCVPPKALFLQGEAEPMLRQYADSGKKAAMAHYDFGFGDKQKDIEEAAHLSPIVAACMAKGGIIVSGQPMVGFTKLDRPDHIGRYFFYQNS